MAEMNIKGLLATLFLILALFVVGVWEAGSHGQMRFRPHMFEDWVMAFLIVCSTGLSLFFLKRAIRSRS